MKKEQITYSVVVPVYNSKKTLKKLYDRLSKVFEEIESTFEVIFVNDNSSDNSYSILTEMHNQFPNILVVDLFKNYGQQNALMCGFNYCKGKYVITLDDDLQNPPEEIPKLIDKLNEGYDAVFGAYEEKKDKKFKNIGSYFVRKINHNIFSVKSGLKFSSFRIIDVEIIKQIKDLKTPYPYVSGMILSLTKKVTNVTVAHNERIHGKSNYSLRKLIDLSFNLIINYSSLPLKLVGYSGLIISIISMFIGLFFVIKKLSEGGTPVGWTSLIVMLSFFSSIILMFLFILGIYISRILREVSNTKQYSVKKVLK